MKSQFFRPVVGSGLGLAVVLIGLLALLKTRQNAPSVSLAASPLVTRKVFKEQGVPRAFSPDGKQLLVSGRDVFDVETAKFLDARSLKKLGDFPTPNGVLTDDWTKYIVCSSVPGPDVGMGPINFRFRLFDTKSRKPLGPYSEVASGSAGSLIISPREDTLALTVGAPNRGWWNLWQIVGGRSLRSTPFEGRFEDGSAAVDCIAFSHSGKEIVAAGDTDTFAVWNVSQRKKLWEHSPLFLPEYSSDEKDIYQVLFSPDDKTIATSGNNSKVRLWSAKTGAPLRVFQGTGTMLFSPDGATLITADENARIQLWNVQSGQLLRTFVSGKPTPGTFRAIAVTRDGKFLAIGDSNGVIALWRIG